MESARSVGRTPVDPPRIADDVSDEQHTYDHREQPVRAEPQVVRHQDGEDNRGEYGAGHRPARLADDQIFRGRLTAHDAGFLLRRATDPKPGSAYDSSLSAMPGGATSPLSMSRESFCLAASLPSPNTPEPAARAIGSPPRPRRM